MITIIEDTRQKPKHHKVKHTHLEEMGVNVLRCALPFGDYSFTPLISVDTKENIEEVAANLVGDHVRFRNECMKAKLAGCHLYILIETTTGIKDIDGLLAWVNPRAKYSDKAVTGDKLAKIMKTMQIRYGVTFMFCDPEESAGMILKILQGEYEDGNG